jgi:hypothetical protein
MKIYKVTGSIPSDGLGVYLDTGSTYGGNAAYGLAGTTWEIWREPPDGNWRLSKGAPGGSPGFDWENTSGNIVGTYNPLGPSEGQADISLPVPAYKATGEITVNFILVGTYNSYSYYADTDFGWYLWAYTPAGVGSMYFWAITVVLGTIGDPPDQIFYQRAGPEEGEELPSIAGWYENRIDEVTEAVFLSDYDSGNSMSDELSQCWGF